uniref:Tubulin--tyrosine ligase-like protein 9 n=2 Tax=Rhizochromulina marina TaxID=1034831 RepID=A0A7S2RL25_9STRA|mmetsp:Transcript_17876/g.52208  ORF Transcript_17876/g.52208 Transcript_17876/m.52208 type:complete len:239 (+) Transcript_17876:1090-1806(+)
MRPEKGIPTEALPGYMKTHSVAQRFVIHPFLYRGRKFHMRIYVFVTRYALENDLRVYVLRRGFAFASSSSYDPTAPDEELIFSRVGDTVETLTLEDVDQEVRRQVPSSTPGAWWVALRRTIGRTFWTFTKEQERLHPGRMDAGTWHNEQGHCFDLFAVDAIMDNNLIPYLLEVNLGPNIYVDRKQAMAQEPVKSVLMESIAQWAADVLLEGSIDVEPPPDFERVPVDVAELHRSLQES